MEEKKETKSTPGSVGPPISTNSIVEKRPANVNQLQSIAQTLFSMDVITQQQLDKAIEVQKHTGESMTEVLINLCYVTDQQIFMFMKTELSITSIELADYEIESDVVSLIPEKICRKYILVPVYKLGKVLAVAMAHPTDIVALDDIKMLVDYSIEPLLATATDITHTLDSLYRGTDQLDQAVRQIEAIGKQAITKSTENLLAKKFYTIQEDKNPIINLVNLIITNAIIKNASDIHLEPFKEYVRLRYRIDGILIEMKRFQKNLFSHVISRIKIMGNMNISEKRVPQDGSISLLFDDSKIDLRLSTYPTVYGEKVVMRVLDSNVAQYSLEHLQLKKSELNKIQRYLKYPHGMIIVTGPTGSGKTTTLYTSLSEVNNEGVNISTIEDPVEYHFDNINQMQVNHELGINFSSGLRTLMRQDPDIILVGEIRDSETAQTALQAALTGHLVFSTLHTNSAAGAFQRLLQFGIDPFVINSSVVCILAQRLLRKLCVHCKKQVKTSRIVTEEAMQKLLPEQIYEAVGCPKCSGTGYQGRVPILEILENGDQIQQFVSKHSSTNEIERLSVKLGMKSLFMAGIDKLFEGITSFEEFQRVTYGRISSS